MGVVVSAIATGLVHNIGADCVHDKDNIQDTDKVEDGVKVTKPKSGDSPHRIQTPGYPTVTLLPSPSSVLKTANINKEYSKSDPPPPPPPPSRLYQPSPSPALTITAPVSVVKHKQTLNTSPAPENINDNKNVENILETIRQDIIDSDISNNNTKSIDYENDEQQTEVNANNHQSNSNNNSLDKNIFSISPELLDKKSESETVNYPETTLPIVSLLPTLTEEITLTLAQSQVQNQSGWFRKHYTSIDTVQKIYGTHPRYQGHVRRRPLSRVSRSSSSASVRHVASGNGGHTSRCSTSLAHSICQDGCYTSPDQRRHFGPGQRNTSTMTNNLVIHAGKKDYYSGSPSERRKHFAKTGTISVLSSPNKEKSRLKNKLEEVSVINL